MKRISEAILENGGFLQKIDYLGFKNLPYRIKGFDKEHSVGRLVFNCF